jgi:serine protease Do
MQTDYCPFIKEVGMKLLPTIAIFLSILVVLSGTTVWAATLQTESPSEDTVGQAIESNDLDAHFENAQKNFLDNEIARAADEIKAGAQIVRYKAAQAKGEARRALLDSAAELDQLSQRVALDFVSSDKDLRVAFAHAHQALAGHYHERAASSWTKRLVKEMGKELSAAATHLKQAWYWSGKRLSEGARQAIASTKNLDEKIGSGVNWVAQDVDKAINDIGKEIGISKTSREIGMKETPEETSKQTSVDLSTAVIQVAKKNIPAVVHIQVTERQEIPNPLLPYENDQNFRQFFGIPEKMPKKFERELVALGTGMIIDAKGHILTNNHVVAGAAKILVILSDGTRYPAKVVGTDPKTDLGVIEISPDRPLPQVTFGDSDAVEVGQWVVAIGHPQGLDETVTQGIISAKHRTGVADPSSYEDFLQTDAPINPGNSGGPLLNLEGEVIGVNSAILSESGGSEGIGFSIPGNMAVNIAQALIAHGKVVRGWLGVDAQDLTPDLAKSFGLAKAGGALVSDVMKESPATAAGIKQGDVILAYGQKKIENASELRNAIADSTVGDVVNVTVHHEGREVQIQVKVGNLEDLTKRLTASLKTRLGISVEPVTDQDALQYGMRAPKGAKISWVDPKGPMGKAGFEKDDIVLAVNEQPAGDVQSFIVTVASLPRRKAAKLLALEHASGQIGSVEVALN